MIDRDRDNTPNSCRFPSSFLLFSDTAPFLKAMFLEVRKWRNPLKKSSISVLKFELRLKKNPGRVHFNLHGFFFSWKLQMDEKKHHNLQC